MFRSHLRLKNCVSNCNWKQSKELKISHIRTKKCIISIIWKEQSRLEGVDGHSFPSSLPIKSREQIFRRERVIKRTCFWQYFITLIISIFKLCSFNSIYGHKLKTEILFLSCVSSIDRKLKYPLWSHLKTLIFIFIM